MPTKKAKPKQGTTSKYSVGQMYMLPINSVTPDPNQPRHYFDDEAIEELSISIKRHGILQPVLVRSVGDDDKFILVTGERRYRSAQQAELENIPAIITDGEPTEIALVENLLRENLTAVEEAEGMQRLIIERGYKQEDLEQIIGKKRNTINEILQITKLPSEILDEIRSDPVYARRELVKISRKPTEKGQRNAFQEYKKRIQKREKAEGSTRVRGDKIQATENNILKLKERLDGAREWKLTDKQKLKRRLVELKAVIDELLAVSS